MASGRTTASYAPGSLLRYFDAKSHENVNPAGAHVSFYEDFTGKAINTTHWWTAIDTSAIGNTTPVLIADSATAGGNGIVSLPVVAQAELEETGLYWGDQRTLVLNQGVQCEWVLAVHTAPTSLTIAVWGLAADKNAVADSVTESIWFRLDAALAVTVESDDTTGATEKTKIATGVTLVLDEYHVFRIDCSTITDVRFYIDGNRVAATTTFDMSAVPALKLQPYIHMAHANPDNGVGEIYVDAVRVWQKRS